METKNDDEYFSYEPPEYGCYLRGCGDPGDWRPVTPAQRAAESQAQACLGSRYRPEDALI